MTTPRLSGRVFGRGWVACLVAVLGVGSLLLSTPAEAATVGQVSATKALGWTAAVADHPRGVFEAVSCPSATWCLGVDDYGNALVDSAGVWSRATPVAPSTLLGVSCASTTFCVAIGLNFVITFNGQTWTLPKVIDQTANPHLLSISCPTTTFCATSNANGYVFTFNGSAWSAPVLVDAARLDAISCVSATFCMASNELGGIDRWDGHSWHAPVAVLDGETPGLIDELVDCVTPTFCEAMSPDSTSTWNGTTWSPRASLVAFPNLLDNLSCSRAGSCAMLDLENTVWTTSTGRTWTKGPNNGFLPSTPQVSPVRGLDCASPTMCLAVGTLSLTYPDQDAKTFNGVSWSPPTIADPYDNGDLLSVSCPTTSFCAAVDWSGYVVVKRGAIWSYPQRLVQNAENAFAVNLSEVACPTVSLCLATDSYGEVFTYNGTTWSGPRLLAPGHARLNDLSCASATLCTVQTDNQNTYIFNGTSWRKGPAAPSGGAAPFLCATKTFCVGFTGNGPFGVRTWNGTTWSAEHVFGQFVPSAVDCASATDCTAADASYSTHWNGTTWSPLHPLTATIGSAMSCIGNGICWVGTYDGVAKVTNGVEGADTALDPLRLYSPNSISCASIRSCVAVSGLGAAFTSG